jgi:hypothetical protein
MTFSPPGTLASSSSLRVVAQGLSPLADMGAGVSGPGAALPWPGMGMSPVCLGCSGIAVFPWLPLRWRWNACMLLTHVSATRPYVCRKARSDEVVPVCDASAQTRSLRRLTSSRWLGRKCEQRQSRYLFERDSEQQEQGLEPLSDAPVSDTPVSVLDKFFRWIPWASHWRRERRGSRKRGERYRRAPCSCSSRRH